MKSNCIYSKVSEYVKILSNKGLDIGSIKHAVNNRFNLDLIDRDIQKFL